MAAQSSQSPAVTPLGAAAQPKTVLIIGANRGIGLELATRFVRRGYTVFGTYRPQTRDDVSVKDLRASKINTLELDFTDEASISRAAEDFGTGPLDILINSAGIYESTWDKRTFLDDSTDDLVNYFKVNAVGPFMASKAFFPALSRAPAAKIINVSSDMASIADNLGGNAPYRISKAAVNQLTKTMAADLAGLGSAVRTLAVHPGFVATKMTGFVAEDDMQTCMDSLVGVIEGFAADDGAEYPSGAYVRWDGSRMDY